MPNDTKKAEERAYHRGYRAGRKEHQQTLIEQRERIYMQALSMVLEHCSGWHIGGEKINDADGYFQLAEIFTDNAIPRINR